jgi:beta-glucosidase
MTLEEKVGQLNQYNGFWDITGPTQKRVKLLKIRRPKKRFSRIDKCKRVKDVKALQKIAEQTRLVSHYFWF